MSRNLFIIVLLIITPFCGWGQVDTIADQKLKPRECLRRVDQFAGSRDTKRWHYFLEWSKRSEYLDGW